MRRLLPLLMLGLFGLTACATSGAMAKKSSAEERLAQEIGIELVSLRTTAGGHMLDLRFRVLNPELATRLTHAASNVPMYVVDPKSGKTAEIPQTMLGLLRSKSSRTRQDHIYYSLFRNPDLVIQPGDKVDLHFGDVVVGWKVN